MLIDKAKGINNLNPARSVQDCRYICKCFLTFSTHLSRNNQKISPLQHPEKLNAFSNSSKLSPILIQFIIETKLSHMISQFPVSQFYPLISHSHSRSPPGFTCHHHNGCTCLIAPAVLAYHSP